MAKLQRHLFLSPHLDDAVLSCGGQIALLTGQGNSVHVVTVFAGDPPKSGLSDFAIFLHREWGGDRDPFVRRRTEDEQALRLLGASFTHLAHLDAIYRKAERDGYLLYPDRKSIFGAVASGESDAFPRRLVEELIPLCDPSEKTIPHASPMVNSSFVPRHSPSYPILHAPLTVGHHVDHQIVRAAALQLAQAGYGCALRFYGDYPYSEESGELEEALEGLPPLRPVLIPYDEAAMQLRLQSIACYASQIGILFGSVEEMEAQTRAHAARLAQEAGSHVPYGEREWVLD